MLKIIRENRSQIENEFIALLLNKNDLLNFIQIKPEYLDSQENRRILESMIECFEKNECVNLLDMISRNKNINVAYLSTLMNDTFWYKSSWREQLKMSEKAIVNFYKEDIIEILNEKRKNNEISYEEFIKKTRKLDDIVLADNATILTKKEIMDNISMQKSRVNLNNFPKLNQILQLVQGDFLIIGATTGAGKSGLMLNLMNDLMTGFQCIYFNMEMSKSTIYKRLISINANITMADVERPQTQYQYSLIEQTIEKIEQAGLIIEHKANDIKQIRATVAKLKNKEKHTILFIDHLGLCKCDGMKSLYEQATEVAKQLRQICLEYDCTIISAAQLNRSAYGTEEVTLNMLKDSGELENSASRVILLYRAKNVDPKNLTPLMNIEVAKNRDGICGIVEMKYNKTKQTFEEIK